jgi:hypothetical protein
MRVGLHKVMLVIAFCAGAVASCGLPQRSPSLTIAQSRRVLELGIPDARFMLSDTAQLQQEFVAAAQREIGTRRLRSFRSGLHALSLPVRLSARPLRCRMEGQAAGVGAVRGADDHG